MVRDSCLDHGKAPSAAFYITTREQASDKRIGAEPNTGTRNTSIAETLASKMCKIGFSLRLISLSFWPVLLAHVAFVEHNLPGGCWTAVVFSID
jgi:hypothetical protein